ncbi:hypothetical protein [Streptomyces sp. rh34]|uniref:hypothetical protein n=1 Tax=Streptomyces sp. rh34 TaxID=2034272 RepID=UPI000BF04620|nr:hypothetical protein [Streptomyces sp. rh34]
MRIRICNVPGCTNKHSARGYCPRCYQRYVRHGNPTYLVATDYDHAVVERAVAGNWNGRMTQAERDETIRRLHRRGLTDRLIANHLDIGTSGVCMARYRLNLPANQAPVGDRSGRAA